MTIPRSNHKMAEAVEKAIRYFDSGRTRVAIAVMKSNRVPESVVIRTLTTPTERRLMN